MIVLSVALSERCNLNCTYCDVDKFSKKSIDPDLFIQEYKTVRLKNPKEKIRVDFHGGEPFLQWGAIKKIVANIDDSNCEYLTCTNGLLLTEKKVDYLNKNNFKVSLSFDGLWQDQNRKQHNGEGTLSTYLSKRSIFSKINKLSCHTMIYDEHNFNLIDNHLYILNKFSFNTEMTLIRDVGVWTPRLVKEFNQAFDELVNWYIDNVNTEKMPGLLLEYARHMLLYSVKRKTMHSCGAGESYFSFTEDKMIPCNRFKKQEDLDKIAKFRYMPECQSCEASKYCKKGCLYENIQNKGPILELCDIYRHIYKKLAKMFEQLQYNQRFNQFILREANDA